MSGPTLLHIGRFNSALHGISLSDSWRIATSKGDDVIWNIVLAYLNSFDASNENELTRRIACLTSDGKVNGNIRKSVQMYNPFLHRNASFSDKVMSELVSEFKDRVEDFIKNDETQFPYNARNCRYLEASSKLLSCNIVLLSFSFRNKIAVTIFPVQGSSKSRTMFTKHISILDELMSTSKDGIPQENFAFCIPKEIGKKKQIQALSEILSKTTETSNEQTMIRKMICLPAITDNFLLSLLKNNFVELLTFIYESPYTLLKLADAGFETDPRTKDSEGKSAFFYALKTEKSRLVFLLYEHAANACLQTDASVRTPDPMIVKNLLCLKDYLKLMEKDLVSEEITEKSRCLFRYLCRFNEFQIDMCKNINNVNSEINYYDHTEKECEILKRKETVLAIIKTYQSYFDYASEESKSSLEADDSISRFKEYSEHKDYFDKLDFYSAVLFLDNLFLLREKLIFQSKSPFDVASSFIFVSCGRYWGRYGKHEKFSRWLIFQERSSLRSQMCDFKEILEKTELSTDNKLNYLPSIESSTHLSACFSEVYCLLSIFRLQHYLNAATGLIVNDLKSILVIERCLQVLGDYCSERPFDAAQIKSFAVLPNEFVKLLKQFRDSLTNIKPQELIYRNNLEQDVELFIGIQNELVKLKKVILPVYLAHKWAINKVLIYSVKSASTARRSILRNHENELIDILPPQEKEVNQSPMPTTSYQQLFKPYFDDMDISLQKKISVLDRNITISAYKQTIQNMFSTIQKVLNNQKTSLFKIAFELNEQFSILEDFLSFITEDRTLDVQRKRLKFILKRRENFFVKYQMNNSNFLISGYSLVAEGKKIGRHFTSKLEAARDSGQETLDPILNFEKIDSMSVLNSKKNTKEYTGVAGLPKTSEGPEKIIQTKRNYIPYARAIGMASHDPVNADSAEMMNIRCLIKSCTAFLNNYKKFAHTIFEKISYDSNEKFHFKNIEKFCLMMFKERTFLNKTEKVFILQSRQKEFENVHKLKGNLKNLLDEETNFTEEAETELFKRILRNREINEKKINTEKALNDEFYRTIDTDHDYFLEIKKKMELNEINREEYELLCKKLKIPDDAKGIISKLVSGQNEEVSGNQFKFLRNRIKILKNILIYENNAIQQLWEKATTPRRKMQVKEKIVQLYLSDSEIQASVEMLLFDCLNILGSKELKNLWESTANLFSAINLRNVFDQCYSLNGKCDYYYYPANPYYLANDLLSELVEKMVKLIADEHVLDCMQQILQQSGANFSRFMQIMDDEENTQFKNLREQVLDCDFWKRYALLIPF